MDARQPRAELARLMLGHGFGQDRPLQPAVIMIWRGPSGASTEMKGTFWRVANGVGTTKPADRDGR